MWSNRVLHLLGVSWDLVKEIHSKYLKRKYSPPSLIGLKNIGIDEFAVKKGHVYKTIVVDLDTGRIVHVGDGKDENALEKFWQKVREKGIGIKHVATDMSAAFIASVMKNVSDAVHVFDHFHVVKLMNEALDDIRRKLYAQEKGKLKTAESSNWKRWPILSWHIELEYWHGTIVAYLQQRWKV